MQSPCCIDGYPTEMNPLSKATGCVHNGFPFQSLEQNALSLA